MTTMADQLLAEARRRGVVVRVTDHPDGATLHIDAPEGAAVDARLVAVLARHRDALLERLGDDHREARLLKTLTPGDGGTRVLLFPAAGTGPGAYRSWCTAAPPGLRVVAVQAPGREERLDEEPLRDVGPLADAVAAAISDDGFTGSTVLVGHSLGALVAYEVALRCPAGTPLVVAAAEPPDRAVDMSGLDDAALLAAMREWTGRDAGPAALECLRADLRMHATCRRDRPAAPPLRGSLVALWGRDDRGVDAGRCGDWVRWTSGPACVRPVPGGHFFPVERPAEVLALVTGQDATAPWGASTFAAISSSTSRRPA